MKILEKRHIIREKKVPYVSREKEVLSRLSHPFFVQLFFTFQDKERLCILCSTITHETEIVILLNEDVLIILELRLNCAKYHSCLLNVLLGYVFAVCQGHLWEIPIYIY